VKSLTLLKYENAQFVATLDFCLQKYLHVGLFSDDFSKSRDTNDDFISPTVRNTNYVIVRKL